MHDPQDKKRTELECGWYYVVCPLCGGLTIGIKHDWDDRLHLPPHAAHPGHYHTVEHRAKGKLIQFVDPRQCMSGFLTRFESAMAIVDAETYFPDILREKGLIE